MIPSILSLRARSSSSVSALALVGALGIQSALGCSDQEGCSAVGCLAPLEARLTSDEILEDGDYRVDVTLDGETVSCEFVVPNDPVGKVCIESGQFIVTYVETGFGVSLEVAAERVALLVDRDGATLADIDYEPEYRQTGPDNPECGPHCAKAADLELSLSPNARLRGRCGLQSLDSNQGPGG